MPDTTAPPWRRLLGQFSAPVPWMLELVIVVQLVLGEYAEAAVIAGLLVFNGALGFFQEARAQLTLSALKSRLALSATARRDGQWASAAAADLVPGDIVKLSLGGVVPADVRIVSGAILLDQSMLTGESVPIEGAAGQQTFAGVLIRRGEAVAEVTATGIRTKFGQTAELILGARVVSSQQKAVFAVVRNLAVFNGVLIGLLIVYSHHLALPLTEIIPLVLTGILASIPVALPATFSLAAALGARALTRAGVLPTRLSAVDEAAMMDVLCADKTGTLTQNQLTVTSVQALLELDQAHILALASLASSDGGSDPVDGAIRMASRDRYAKEVLSMLEFTPFDPATKMSAASYVDQGGLTQKVLKGAFAAIAAQVAPSAAATSAAGLLEAQGFRVLAVACGTPSSMRMVGLIALSDPPRADSAPFIAELSTLGVRTVMVTGDAPATATIVARAVGLTGPVCPAGPIPDSVKPETYSVFAAALPGDKFRLVKAFQKAGHTVGMCGDGVNDAPALRQAQMGIAVSSASDVARAAAGIVLTTAGLSGIVTAIKEGRQIYQRILTYTLNSITKKMFQVLFLGVGLLMTGHAILTPLLMVLIMITGDFLGMALTTDNVRASARPNTWRITPLTVAGGVMGIGELAFCSAALAFGKYHLNLPTESLRTLAFVVIVFANQATTYTNRERLRLWTSRPSSWLILSSASDVTIASCLALSGVAMVALPASLVMGLFAGSIVFALMIDFVKVPLLARLRIS
jgi:H+-transporting ATPase